MFENRRKLGNEVRYEFKLPLQLYGVVLTYRIDQTVLHLLWVIYVVILHTKVLVKWLHPNYICFIMMLKKIKYISVQPERAFMLLLPVMNLLRQIEAIYVSSFRSVFLEQTGPAFLLQTWMYGKYL
jgi:hypothetical protein